MTQRVLLGVALAYLWAALGHAEVQFVEVAAEAGIAFRHQNGAKGQKYPMETMGSGTAFFDYDGDGWLDLYFVNSAGPGALYRNASAGQFVDATDQAGVANSGYGLGCAAADYDSDGDLDLYVTAYGPNILYRNEGTSRFADVTEEAGLLSDAAKELGAFFIDYDTDGDLDLYAAGDRTPNLLYRNDGGRFAEIGALAGVAYNDAGKPLAGMGVDVGDYDSDGRFDFFVTNYQWETNSLYRNLGNGFFADVTFQSGLGVPSLQFLAWGTLFIDYDNDGDRDLFVANGHLDDNIHLFDAVTYAQQNQLFRNREGHFADVSNQAGPGLLLQQVSRGAAMGDYDNDGDRDIAVANNNQSAALLRNDGGNAQHYLSLRLVGNSVGAEVRVAAGDWVRWDVVRAGSSYLCQSALRPFFGLGNRTRVDEVEIRWPSGAVQRLQDVAADQILTVHEP